MFLLERMICHQAIFVKKQYLGQKFDLDYKIISDRNWLYNIYKQIISKSSDTIVVIYDTCGISSNRQKFDKESLAFAREKSLFFYVFCKMKRWLSKFLRK